MNTESTEQASDFDFNGTWITDSIGVMTLEQKERRVTGIYTGREGGTIVGIVQGNHLDFTWHEGLITVKSEGRGTLEGIPGTRTVTGYWEDRLDEAKSGVIKAEALDPLPPHLSPQNLPPQDKIALKYAGYDLVRHRHYEQALGPLEQALELYRAELQTTSVAKDAYLIDEVRILASLLECYFELAQYSQMPDPPAHIPPKEYFYAKLLEHLLSSVSSYQQFLQRTFQQHTYSPLKELTKAAEALKHWQEQLVTQAAVLRNKESQEHDPRIPRMISLASQLKNSYEYLVTTRDYLLAQGTQSFGKSEALLRALTSLMNYYQVVQQRIHTDVEQMLVLGKDWPEEQREFIQWLSLLLQPIPLHLEGTCRLIAQAQKNVEERVGYTWEAVFRLSDWLEKWRVRLLTDPERIGALEEGQPFFQMLIQFYVGVDNGTEALVLSERARARALADLLAARATSQTNVTTEQWEMSRYPGFNSTAPTTVEDILEIVQRRQSTTIEYFLMQDQLIIWVVSPTGKIETIIVPVGEDKLEKLVSRLLQLLQSLALSNDDRAKLSDILQELHEYLIEPIPARFLPTASEGMLTIIPHRALFEIPFAALKNKSGTYLIEEYALVYAPSIDILRYTYRNKDRVVHARHPRLLAFVNPDLPSGSNLSTLEFTEQNFASIVAFYPDSELNKIYTGKDAVRQILEQEASHYTVLCFVTHAKALNNDPLNSYLVLANGSSVDGNLKVPDISRLNLHTDLVILSACETGRGDITGDGVNGLSRAFISAGTPSLLVSLWSIAEKESLEQLYLFHEFWRVTGTLKAQALRQAQIERLNQYREQPDVWAAFALIGEGA